MQTYLLFKDCWTWLHLCEHWILNLCAWTVVGHVRGRSQERWVWMFWNQKKTEDRRVKASLYFRISRMKLRWYKYVSICNCFATCGLTQAKMNLLWISCFHWIGMICHYTLCMIADWSQTDWKEMSENWKPFISEVAWKFYRDTLSGHEIILTNAWYNFRMKI